MERFLKAQETMYDIALKELQAGEKQSHWIWFIFPQLYGLGTSEMSRTYGIRGPEEAKMYLNHPVLYPRLVACCEALLSHKGKAAEEIMGGDVDAVKLQSSMTLFAFFSESDSVFHQVLKRFYHGITDRETVKRLEAALGTDTAEILLPEGVTDTEDWSNWVRAQQRQGKQELELRVARRIISDLLKAGYTEEFLKELREKFEVWPDGVEVNDTSVMMILTESDWDEEYPETEPFL